MAARKRDKALVYLRNILGALIALPVSLLIITVIIIAAVLLLPVLWFIIIVWWVNGFRHTVLYGKQDTFVAEDCEL